MAYGSNRTNGNNILRPNRSQSGSSNISLNIRTTDGDYLCESNKIYTEKSSIIQDLTNTDSFITLSSFSKNLAALTVQNAKAIVLKNISNVCQEIMITMYDWLSDSASTPTTMDIHNSIDINPEATGGGATALRTISMLLPAGEFVYLPNNRILSYALLDKATLESAALAGIGTVGIEPKDINSGNEFVDVKLISGTTYRGGAAVLTTEVVDIDETEIGVDNGYWFKVGDLIMIDSEVMSVESISTNTLTVKRGLLGSTAVAHSDDDPLFYFFGNEHLAFNNGRCMTDSRGRFSQKGAFFGYARSADQKADGLVPGSVAIGPFYSGASLAFGLSGISPSDETGLAASTAYTFTVVFDDFQANGWGATGEEIAIAFTTDSSDTTFSGSGNAVLPKIQAVFDEQSYTTGSVLKDKKVTISLINGDVVVKSDSYHSGSIVGIGNTTGTTPFGVGRFPAKDGSSIPILKGTPTGSSLSDAAITIVYGAKSTLMPETKTDPVTGKEIQNLDAFLIDDGKGNLLHNGSVVGKVDYITGHCSFTHLSNAEFKIYAESQSAHSGGSKYISAGYNTISAIDARSVNAKADSKIEMLLLG